MAPGKLLRHCEGEDRQAAAENSDSKGLGQGMPSSGSQEYIPLTGQPGSNTAPHPLASQAQPLPLLYDVVEDVRYIVISPFSRELPWCSVCDNDMEDHLQTTNMSKQMDTGSKPRRPEQQEDTSC